MGISLTAATITDTEGLTPKQLAGIAATTIDNTTQTGGGSTATGAAGGDVTRCLFAGGGAVLMEVTAWPTTDTALAALAGTALPDHALDVWIDLTGQKPLYAHGAIVQGTGAATTKIALRYWDGATWSPVGVIFGGGVGGSDAPAELLWPVSTTGHLIGDDVTLVPASRQLVRLRPFAVGASVTITALRIASLHVTARPGIPRAATTPATAPTCNSTLVAGGDGYFEYDHCPYLTEAVSGTTADLATFGNAAVGNMNQAGVGDSGPWRSSYYDFDTTTQRPSYDPTALTSGATLYAQVTKLAHDPAYNGGHVYVGHAIPAASAGQGAGLYQRGALDPTTGAALAGYTRWWSMLRLFYSAGYLCGPDLGDGNGAGNEELIVVAGSNGLTARVGWADVDGVYNAAQLAGKLAVTYAPNSSAGFLYADLGVTADSALHFGHYVEVACLAEGTASAGRIRLWSRQSPQDAGGVTAWASLWDSGVLTTASAAGNKAGGLSWRAGVLLRPTTGLAREARLYEWEVKDADSVSDPYGIGVV